MKRVRVGIIFGGRSGEHEISLMSARSIVDALDRERYEAVLIGIDPEGRWHLEDAGRALLGGPGAPLELDTAAPELAMQPGGGALLPAGAPGAAPIDVFFPVLHGTYGEDGTVQGLLEMAGLPYVGSGVLGSAIGMDKDVAKRLLRDAGLLVADYRVVQARQWARPGAAAALEAEVAARLGWPCFVKPANAGSSVGVHKVKTAAALAAAVTDALRYDRKVLVERAVVGAREIEVAVLGNDAPEASVPGEVVPNAEFYSYQAKYIDADGARLVIPAALTPEQAAEARALAVRAFQALELAGMARVDFLMEQGSGTLYLNEVNTIPGFTKISMYPKMWEHSGLGYRDLVSRLIELALERHAARSALSTRYLPET
ncbi:MAG: D-alanine--D-alanine ligase [Deltaproteobacteria bacterium]|nr:D-alanine--D-alanine ligase [Deltaproteobacteria bacterium]